jgi:uncharacterized membrane protein
MATKFLPPLKREVNLWRIPLLLSIAALALFAFTITIDTLSAQGTIHLPAWVSNGGIDDARSILEAEMGAVSTVLALIFSVSLLVLSMVATLFGPRLLYRFVQDWITQTTIGLFMSTFIFILLTFVVTHADHQDIFIPQVTLLTASLLVLLSFACLVYYSHRIAISIQNPDMIAKIVDDIESIVRSDDATERGSPAEDAQAVELTDGQLANGALIYCHRSGYLQILDQKKLVAQATAGNAVINFVFRPGHYVQQGEPIANIYPASSLKSIEAVSQKCIHIGRHRVLTQDVEFAIYQIVEIGIRALSPAVNDTFTGVACVDCIGDALRILTETPANDGLWYDKAGNLRLKVPPLKFERAAKLGFEQLRQAGADNPAILIRILSTIARLAPKLQDSSQRQALLEQATAAWEIAANNNLATIDRRNIEDAWLKTHALLTEPSLSQQ